MTQKSIAIVGGGIVGATAAYYLARQGYQPVLYDWGQGQATKAAAGIINPWFSLRRNQAWFQLVAHGAEFYRQFMEDLKQDGYPHQAIFQVDGALMIRHSDKGYVRDLKQAQEKLPLWPAIGQVKTVKARDYFPFLKDDLQATYVEGGGRVDGEQLIRILHRAIQDLGGTIHYQAVNLNQRNNGLEIQVEGQSKTYDQVLLAVGAWLPILLEPLNYQVKIHPQKGQLYIIQDANFKNQHWPVVMPPGLGDIIPFNDGRIIIGATHEEDQAYNLDPDLSQLEALRQHVSQIAPDLAAYPIQTYKVGTRAQSQDYSVVLGQVPGLNQVWTVSGLGSSGLTSGPYLGYQWAKLVSQGKWDIDTTAYPIEAYIQKL